MPFLTSKVTPSSHEEPKQEEIDNENNEIAKKIVVKMHVILLHTLFKRYGGQRHPKIEPYEEFRDRGGTAKPFQPLRVRFKESRNRRSV